MKPKVTINDIARASGTSVSTVSLALNDRPGVSQETRSRVLEIASQLGYTLKPAAPAVKREPTPTIGMLVKIDPDTPPQANPFYSKVMLGIEDACRRKGINLLFASLPVDEEYRPLEVPSLLQNEMLMGLLIVGTYVDESFSDLSCMGNVPGLPIILVDGYSNTDCYDAVLSDNFHAAFQAVQYLIDKGHRSIGLAGSCEVCYPSLMDRRNGYLRALKENNLPAGEAIASFNINKSQGFQEITGLLQQRPDITALFCVNDDVASASVRAALSLGLRVPEDLSVIGYDDTYIAANTHPALTTMHVDTVAMGRAAVHLLNLRLENPEAARMTLTIHPTLIERESVVEHL